MQWKEQLRQFELQKQWNDAIDYMVDIIDANPTEMDPYIYMIFLLMNTVIEEEYDRKKYEYYEALIQHYFKQSYPLFNHDPKYLFWVGITSVMAEWFIGITYEQYMDMLHQAMLMEPNNLIYKKPYYASLDTRAPQNEQELTQYLKLWLDENSDVVETTKSWGAFGEYLINVMHGKANYFFKYIIPKNHLTPD